MSTVMKRAARIAAAIGTAGLLLAGGSALAAQGSKNLLWVQPLRDHPVHKIMQAGFLDRCKEIGYTCEVVGNPSASNYDVSATIPLAEAALARQDWGAVAVYTPDPAIFPFIQKLADENLPVVTWHMMPDEGTVPGLLATTGEDVAEAGANAAIAMGEKLGGQGVVALTEGSFNSTENTMAESFTNTMKEKYPNITVLPAELEGFEPAGAIAKATSILQAHPDVTGAFSTTGYGPQTWSGAVRNTGRTVTIISMDYTRQNLDLVKSGEVYGLVAQPLYEEGAQAADLAAALAQGQTVTYRNVIPAKVITAADLDPYYQILDSAGQ